MKRKITMIMLYAIPGLLLFAMLLCSACGMARKDSITVGESSRSTAAANQTDADKAQSTADLSDQPDEFYMIVKHDTSPNGDFTWRSPRICVKDSCLYAILPTTITISMRKTIAW